jgi:hypothetical protein
MDLFRHCTVLACIGNGIGVKGKTYTQLACSFFARPRFHSESSGP